MVAVEDSRPEMAPALGAESGIVKTSGSGTDGAPGVGLFGVMIEEEGKSM